MKVLLIQHQNHARKLFRHLLSKEDCQVHECASFEAVSGLQRHGPFDLVCIDEPLPDTKPLESIRRLRSLESTTDAAIVALIRNEHERGASALISAGANDYMVLPAPLEEVQQRLSVILGWARRAASNASASNSPSQPKDKFFDSLPDAAVLLDRVGTVVAANERLATLTGYTVQQLIGQPAEFIGLPMAEEMPGLLEEAASARDKLEDVTLVRRDMKPVPAVIRYAWLDPEVRSIVVGVARETGETGEIGAGQPNSGRGRKARPGYLEFDRQGVIRAANRPLADALRTSRDQLVGSSLRGLIHRDDLSSISRIMAPTGGSDAGGVSGKLRLKTGDGEWVELDLVGTAQGSGREGKRFRLEEFVQPADTPYDLTPEEQGIDRVTGLVARDEFIESIGQALETNSAGNPVVVLFLDIDRFKLINERHGYATGDRFLAAFAARLKELITFADVAGRIGSDEFALLVGVAGNIDEAESVARAIAEDLLSRSIVVGGKEHLLTASIGIALAEPGTIAPAELLRRADGAATRAKSEGRGKVQTYESSIERRTSDRLELEQDLLQALNRDELVVYYQPEVDLNTGAILGVEALVRWRHPVHGLIEPSRFISTAEDSGLIDPIGLWVLKQSSQDAATWISRYALRDFSLSVNYSANQFLGDNLLMEISSALRRAGLPPAALRVEITESVLIDDHPDVLKRLRQIRRLGVNLAIDDFGTGHASMTYLRSLPVNFLKVDRSFVSGASAQSGELSLTRSIATIAREAGLHVVVEGIETGKQLQRVREIGCRRGQGYYFSRPVAAETIEFLLMAGSQPFAGILGGANPDQASVSSSSSS